MISVSPRGKPSGSQGIVFVDKYEEKLKQRGVKPHKRAPVSKKHETHKTLGYWLGLPTFS